MQQKNQAMAMMNCSMQGLSIQADWSNQTQSQQLVFSNGTSAGQNYSNGLQTAQYDAYPQTAWTYWQNCYYPQVILQSYPVYLQDKAMDKGKQAFEILKSLLDKKLIKLDKVSDFVEAMDTILKTL